MKSLLQQLLNNFNSVSLNQIQGVSLLNRQDRKYLLKTETLLELFPQLKADYYILETENGRISNYQTDYYDTPELHFYLAHHNGKENRLKIRYRSYGAENGYLEVKHKTNTSRTIKHRMLFQEKPKPQNASAVSFLNEYSNINFSQLKQTLSVNYKRITLVNKCFTERITFDLETGFVQPDQTEAGLPFVIAELKQNKSGTSVFSEHMRNKGVQEVSFSKYCIGMALTKTNLKTNNFKPIIHQLKKLSHDK
jgi:hypothetical protein